MGAGALLAGLPALLVRTHVVPLLVADRSLFVVCLLVTVGATVLLLPVHEREAAITSSVSPAPGGASWDARASLPTMLKLAVFFALQGAGLGLVVQLLPLWFALRFHTTAAAIAPWFAAAQLVGLLTIPLVPALARRLGTARMILLVAALSTLMLAGVPFAPVLPLAGLFYVLRSGFVSMQWPAQQSFLQGAVDPRVRGTATSLALGCWSITNALLPTLAGYLMDRRLLAWPLVLGLACYSMAAIWFWLTLRHTLLPEEMAAHEVPVTGPGTVEPVKPSVAR
jgi:MFS family permease